MKGGLGGEEGVASATRFNPVGVRHQQLPAKQTVIEKERIGSQRLVQKNVYVTGK